MGELRAELERSSELGLDLTHHQGDIMLWIELVTLITAAQLLTFAFLVGQARGKHKLAPPAMSGHPIVERYIRVHLNSLELSVVFLPSLWLAARYWDERAIAAVGFAFIIGRVLYFKGYTADAGKRFPGFIISLAATSLLIVAALVGLIRVWLNQ